MFFYANHAQVEMRFDGEALSELPDEDHWYEFQLTNEHGKVLPEIHFWLCRGEKSHTLEAEVNKMLSFLYWLFRDALFFFGMVSSRGSFPKPLSREEERKAIAAMQAGDEDARRRLIEHNLRLVSHIAKKYTVPGYTSEDLVSVGTLGLIKAVNTFKPDAGPQLSSYAARCIENEILMLLRASRKRRGDVSLSDPVGTDGEGNDISFMDILGTDAGYVEDEAVRRLTLQKVQALVKKLPRKERMVIEMRYGLLDGVMHPQHEAAAVLGISRSYISRIEKRGLEMLRAGLEGGE